MTVHTCAHTYLIALVTRLCVCVWSLTDSERRERRVNERACGRSTHTGNTSGRSTHTIATHTVCGISRPVVVVLCVTTALLYLNLCTSTMLCADRLSVHTGHCAQQCSGGHSVLTAVERKKCKTRRTNARDNHIIILIRVLHYIYELCVLETTDPMAPQNGPQA